SSCAGRSPSRSPRGSWPRRNPSPQSRRIAGPAGTMRPMGPLDDADRRGTSPFPGPAAIALLVAIAAAAVAGCRGGGGIAPLKKFDEKPPPSARQRATAYAHAVNLRPADVPYFEAQPAENETKKDPLQLEFEREFRRCAGVDGNPLTRGAE